jgi:hypothetical protein
MWVPGPDAKASSRLSVALTSGTNVFRRVKLEKNIIFKILGVPLIVPILIFTLLLSLSYELGD